MPVRGPTTESKRDRPALIRSTERPPERVSSLFDVTAAEVDSNQPTTPRCWADANAYTPAGLSKHTAARITDAHPARQRAFLRRFAPDMSSAWPSHHSATTPRPSKNRPSMFTQIKNNTISGQAGAKGGDSSDVAGARL